MTAPDRMWIWNKETDLNTTKPSKKYLSEYTEVLVATPERERAAELVEALRGLVEMDTKATFSEFRSRVDRAQALLASLEKQR